MPFIVTVPVDALVITLEDARMQCQIDADITDEDTLLERLIRSAADYCERYTGVPLITQQHQYVGHFRPSIELKANLSSIESITYIDQESQPKILDQSRYYVDIASTVGRVVFLASCPNTAANHPQPVTINFTCGYGAAENVPESIKQCVRLLVNHWYRHRENSGAITGDIAETAASLLNNYRIVTL